MRRLTLGDVDAVVALDAEAYAPGLWTREQYVAEVEREQGFAIGAVSETGALLGMLFMAAVLDEAMITNLCAARSARRRGLATQLLDAALADGCAAGVHLFVLEVRRANRAAQKLYKSRGFVQAGLRKGYYAGPRDDAAVLLLRCPALAGVAEESAEGDGVPMPALEVLESTGIIMSDALRAGVLIELRPLWPADVGRNPN
ncbi:acyl-CoA N-acyltransferase [Pavlovales sp. CCMP2436]|nr:acyl-CoA N-acyltransferase [Pavlovales sp. CCMP2436]